MKPTIDDRLHAALDARRDPLDDPELVRELGSDPDALERYAALAADLRALPRVEAPAARPTLARPLALAALAAAAALVAVVVWPRASAPADDPLAADEAPEPAQPVATAPRPRLVSLDSTTARRDGDVVVLHRSNWSAAAAPLPPTTTTALLGPGAPTVFSTARTHRAATPVSR